MELDQYGHIKTKVWNLLRIDLNSYKSEQMCRRLDSWLVRSNTTTWDEYFRRLQSDAKELSKFRDYLTINVSEFFRDTDRWKTIQEQVIPQLIKDNQAQRSTKTGLRIWSAGCSTGQEPYTLAIIMDELAPMSDYSVLATDLDRGALQKAMERGPYSQDDVRNVSPERRAKYFDQTGNTFHFKEKYARHVKFRELNLFLDPFETNLDLIVCRNVIIYFTTEAKQELYKHFQSALRPGGILFLGGTEIIPYPNEYGLRSQGISLYKRD
jgi:chemotaxis protein methyltransferase CheR